MKNLVFVYGSLLEGLHNHSVLGKHKKLVGTGNIKGFNMWSINDAFPAIMPVRKGIIVGEVYEVDDETMVDLDRLEGNGFMYQRELVFVRMKDSELIRAWIYVYIRQDISKGICPFIPNGDWRTYLDIIHSNPPIIDIKENGKEIIIIDGAKRSQSLMKG